MLIDPYYLDLVILLYKPNPKLDFAGKETLLLFGQFSLLFILGKNRLPLFFSIPPSNYQIMSKQKPENLPRKWVMTEISF